MELATPTTLILFCAASAAFVAVLYTSVGQVGASGFVFEVIKPTALVLNVLVSSVSESLLDFPSKNSLSKNQ
jgi:hypothetical protein